MTSGPNYRTSVKPVWCPGCGNYAVLNSLTRLLINLNIPRHETFLVSGIGCSSRITGYVNAFGLNSIHGRAVVIAQGAKLANPKVKVIAIGGDGDFFSIGAGHMIHAVRRNIDITCIMLDNFVYALTGGQTSPTTPNRNGGAYPPVNPMLDMVSYSAATGSSFIAQGIASDVAHLAALMKAGIEHKGFSFISVLTPCVTYGQPDLFAGLKAKASYLREGEPVDLPKSSDAEPWQHNPDDIGLALKLARVPVTIKPYLGIFFRGRTR